MTFDPLEVLIAVTIFTFVVCGWAYWSGRNEAKEEEQVADDDVKHTEEYYDRDRNR